MNYELIKKLQQKKIVEYVRRKKQATANETALQIRQKGIAKKVIGLSITGSFKGFDVISEV